MRWWRRLNLPHKCRVTIIDAEGNGFLVLPGDTVTVRTRFDLDSGHGRVTSAVRGTTKHDLRVEKA